MTVELGNATQYTFKVVVIGQDGVGKRSILNFLCNNKFYSSSGFENYSKKFHIQQRVVVTLQLWNANYSSLSQNLFNSILFGAQAVIIVYDSSQTESYLAVPDLIQRVNAKCIPSPYLALVANKSDLLPHVSEEQHLYFLSKYGMYGYRTCALAGDGVRPAFTRIAADLAGVPLSDEDIEDITGGRRMNWEMLMTADDYNNLRCQKYDNDDDLDLTDEGVDFGKPYSPALFLTSHNGEDCNGDRNRDDSRGISYYPINNRGQPPSIKYAAKSQYVYPSRPYYEGHDDFRDFNDIKLGAKDETRIVSVEKMEYFPADVSVFKNPLGLLPEAESMAKDSKRWEASGGNVIFPCAGLEGKGEIGGVVACGWKTENGGGGGEGGNHDQELVIENKNAFPDLKDSINNALSLSPLSSALRYNSSRINPFFDADADELNPDLDFLYDNQMRGVGHMDICSPGERGFLSGFSRNEEAVNSLNGAEPKVGSKMKELNLIVVPGKRLPVLVSRGKEEVESAPCLVAARPARSEEKDLDEDSAKKKKKKVRQHQGDPQRHVELRNKGENPSHSSHQNIAGKGKQPLTLPSTVMLVHEKGVANGENYLHPGTNSQLSQDPSKVTVTAMKITPRGFNRALFQKKAATEYEDVDAGKDTTNDGRDSISIYNFCDKNGDHGQNDEEIEVKHTKNGVVSIEERDVDGVTEPPVLNPIISSDPDPKATQVGKPVDESEPPLSFRVVKKNYGWNSARSDPPDSARGIALQLSTAVIDMLASGNEGGKAEVRGAGEKGEEEWKAVERVAEALGIEVDEAKGRNEGIEMSQRHPDKTKTAVLPPLQVKKAMVNYIPSVISNASKSHHDATCRNMPSTDDDYPSCVSNESNDGPQPPSTSSHMDADDPNRHNDSFNNTKTQSSLSRRPGFLNFVLRSRSSRSSDTGESEGSSRVEKDGEIMRRSLSNGSMSSSRNSSSGKDNESGARSHELTKDLSQHNGSGRFRVKSPRQRSFSGTIPKPAANMSDAGIEYNSNNVDSGVQSNGGYNLVDRTKTGITNNGISKQISDGSKMEAVWDETKDPSPRFNKKQKLCLGVCFSKS